MYKNYASSMYVLSCTHFDPIDPDIQARLEDVKIVQKMGSEWVHSSLCLTCGKVDCSATLLINKYGTKHFISIGHPALSENWKWCYVDEALIA